MPFFRPSETQLHHSSSTSFARSCMPDPRCVLESWLLAGARMHGLPSPRKPCPSRRSMPKQQLPECPLKADDLDRQQWPAPPSPSVAGATCTSLRAARRHGNRRTHLSVHQTERTAHAVRVDDDSATAFSAPLQSRCAFSAKRIGLGPSAVVPLAAHPTEEPVVRPQSPGQPAESGKPERDVAWLRSKTRFPCHRKAGRPGRTENACLCRVGEHSPEAMTRTYLARNVEDAPPLYGTQSSQYRDVQSCPETSRCCVTDSRMQGLDHDQILKWRERSGPADMARWRRNVHFSFRRFDLHRRTPRAPVQLYGDARGGADKREVVLVARAQQALCGIRDVASFLQYCAGCRDLRGREP
jgi:hypothetical protein